MKAKLLILSAILALSLTTPAFAKRHVVQTRNGKAIVTNTGHHRNHWRSSSGVSWSVGIGLPFYGGYYGATLTTAGTLITAITITADIRTALTATVITLTDTDTTPAERFIAVTTARLLPAYRNGSPALDIIVARSMA